MAACFGTGSNRISPRFPPSPLPITAHAGGQLQPAHCTTKEELWIAIQAGQSVLTSIFFAHRVSTYIQPWRTKEHDRTVRLQQTGGNFMKEATEWPLSPYLSPSYIFKGRSCNTSIPPLRGRHKAFNDREYKALLAASFLFANRVVLIWFYNQGNEGERPRFTWVRSDSSWTVSPRRAPCPRAHCHQLMPPLSQAAQIHQFCNSFRYMAGVFSAAHLWGINQGWKKT